MSQPGPVIGGFILTALIIANFRLSNATIVIALGCVLLFGLIMMLARQVKQEVADKQRVSVTVS